MDRNEALFTSAPVHKAFLTLSLPVVLGMVAGLVYNMVDTYFIGRLQDANQMAAVSLCGPVFMILMGFGNIFGIGGSSVVSRLLGQKKDGMARRATSLCFWVGMIVGLIILVGLLALQSQVLALLGTSENTIVYTAEYLRWFSLSAPLMMINFTLMNLLRCDGAAKESMLGSMAGSVVNMVLDPLLIFGLKMGVAGAAIATDIGYVVSCACFILYVTRKSENLSISLQDFQWDIGLLGGVFAIGLPASVTNALTSVATVLLNNMLLPYGDTAIAAMGIAMKVNQIVILLQIGFAGGLPPIIGYNYGACNMKRLKTVLKAAIEFTVCMGTVLTVAVYIAAPYAVRMFMDAEEIAVPGARMLRALMPCGPFLGVLFIITNCFQATGKALPAMLLSLCRQGVIFLAVLFAANQLFGWSGILYAQAAADYLTLFFSLGLFAKVLLPALRRTEE